jgi:tetratricopeptide (TPR) repeat protein
MSESVARRLSLIGRRNEKQSIINAIQDQNLRIIFLEGDPGIGKTVLLQEARRIAHELGLISPPIVDFYDTKMHAHRDLEDAIANNLDLGEEAFREYRVRREQMERTLAREHKTLKEQEEELWGLFVEGYNHVAKERRVLLCFDTAELLEYEQDSEEVMADCEVSPQDAPSWEWLLNRIGELENTVVLIAARPTPTGLLKQGLLEAHRDCVTAIEVRGFTLEETKAYFEADDGFGSEVANKDPETVTKVHLLTNGRPILIALALDWLARGTWESEIYPASLEELETWQAEAQEEERKGHQGKAWQQWNEVKRKFEVALVEHIRTLDHSGLDVAVKYAALARKGCNAELLALLMDSSPQEAEGHVEQLLDLSFVKQPRGNRKLFFLHDEMYDLVEKYVWRVQWPDHTRQAMLDKIIIDWYEQQIKDLGQQIKGCRIWEERSKMRRQQQHIMVERLYYQLDTDPQQGYREYSRLDEQAIGSRELDWDVLLRNEVLWFTAHRGWRLVAKGPTQQRNGKIERSPWVDYDCRRRWVNRYIARGEWKKAVRIAEKLLARPQHAEESRFALYRPGLHIALGTAQAYLGGVTSELALQNLDDGIRIIEDSAEQALEEHQNPWLASYLLGTANLYKGVALRNTLRLAETANAYRQATRYYRQIEYLPGQAEALNNLAYIYARQGKPRRALSPCDEALRIREELGDEYPIGLSLNTKGIIYERLGLPETACRFSQQALKLFQNIPNERGIVLAEINLGRSLRRKGRSLEWGKKHDFSRADKNLSDAVSRLEGWGANREVFYEVEAYNEESKNHVN